MKMMNAVSTCGLAFLGFILMVLRMAERIIVAA